MKTLALTFLLSGAAALAQQQFASPDAAAQALIGAAAANNTAQLNAIFGPQSRTLLTSGNEEQDKADRQEFVNLARQEHRLEPDSMNPNRMILSIGDEDWPFAVPIVKNKDGKWSFDSSTGVTAMKARRVGEDETDTIEICTGFVDSERQYAENHPMHQYAAKVADLSGMVPQGFIQSSTGQSLPYHGYYFRVLTAQGPDAPGGKSSYVLQGNMIGGFGLVAWPAEYGVTGVNTFIVNQDGIVYEKDFGPRQNNTIPPVSQYNPDPEWSPVN